MTSTFFEEYKEMYEDAGDTWDIDEPSKYDDKLGLDYMPAIVGNRARQQANPYTTGIPPVFTAEAQARMLARREEIAIATLISGAG